MPRPQPALWRTFVDLPDAVEPWFRALPIDRLDQRRTPEAWTLREHLYHVALVQPLLLGRMVQLRDEERPVIRPYLPQNEPDLADRWASVDEAFSAYRRTRQDQVALLEALAPEVWDRPAIHPEYEAYNLGLLVHHLVFHEYWHFYRVEELWWTRDEAAL